VRRRLRRALLLRCTARAQLPWCAASQAPRCDAWSACMPDDPRRRRRRLRRLEAEAQELQHASLQLEAARGMLEVGLPAPAARL
jgi:hypothetical protein